VPVAGLPPGPGPDESKVISPFDPVTQAHCAPSGPGVEWRAPSALPGSFALETLAGPSAQLPGETVFIRIERDSWILCADLAIGGHRRWHTGLEQPACPWPAHRESCRCSE